MTLRVWYLWLKQIIRNAVARCSICDRTGVTSWSIHPEGLCDACDAGYQKAFKLYGSSKMVEDYIRESGKKSFLIAFVDVNMNPLADSQEDLENDELVYSKLVNTGCIIDEDEDFPCFDTFPATPPPYLKGGHPAANSTKLDQTKAMGFTPISRFDY